MRFLKQILIAATLPMLVPVSAAMAQSYSGRWPLTVSHSQRSNGTYCLTLTDDGSYGWPHSGPASLVGGGFAASITQNTRFCSGRHSGTRSHSTTNCNSAR
jgi:hypothetical protein